MSRGNDVTMVLALNRISALSGFFFWNALRYQFMDKCLLLCEVSQKSIRRVSRYLGISINMIKVYNLCMHWRLDLMQTNLLLFGCFRKDFITLRFANDPYTLQKPLNASTPTRFRNIWKHMNQGEKQCCLF